MLNRQLRLFALTSVLALCAAAGARAQDGLVRGRVTDSAGTAIPDADVAIVEIHALTRTDAQGRFTFTRVPRGAHEVTVRRLGFQPATVEVIVNDMAYSYDVVMAARAAHIDGVDVNAEDTRLRLGIEDFYRRRARGAGGLFFTRGEIAARNPRRTTDLLRNAAGLRIVGTRNGSGVRFDGQRQCTPTLWLDGQQVRGLELDNIPVTDIEGIELYSGPSTTPMQFSHGSSRTDCGAIVVWTRIPGTP